jgi:hypothetical protein
VFKFADVFPVMAIAARYEEYLAEEPGLDIWASIPLINICTFDLVGFVHEIFIFYFINFDSFHLYIYSCVWI